MLLCTWSTWKYEWVVTTNYSDEIMNPLLLSFICINYNFKPNLLYMYKYQHTYKLGTSCNEITVNKNIIHTHTYYVGTYIYSVFMDILFFCCRQKILQADIANTQRDYLRALTWTFILSGIHAFIFINADFKIYENFVVGLDVCMYVYEYHLRIPLCREGEMFQHQNEWW